MIMNRYLKEWNKVRKKYPNFITWMDEVMTDKRCGNCKHLTPFLGDSRRSHMFCCVDDNNRFPETYEELLKAPACKDHEDRPKLP